MAKKDEQGNWIDPRGKAIPPSRIFEPEKRRDAVVEACHKLTAKLEKDMLKAKTSIMEKLTEYIAWLEQNQGVERKGKGNMTLTSFSGDLQVEIVMDDITDFDERLQLAKTLIDECLEQWAGESGEQIATVVREAFNLDKAGKINQHMVLRLLKLKINDKRWIRATEIIRESIQVKGTRQYLNLRRKNVSESGSEQWEKVNLNFSAM